MVDLIAENAILAIAGGVAGMAVAAAAVRGFLSLAPSSVPLLHTVQLNLSALGGACAITCFAMVLFGLAPAFATARADVQGALRLGTRQTGSRQSRLVGESLVAAQVALAVVMLSSAALLGRSFLKLQGADLAFDPSRVVIAELALEYNRFPDVDAQVAVIRQRVGGVRSTPGVSAITPVVAVPFSGTGGWDGRAATEGQTPADVATNPAFNMEVVTPEYFDTFGIAPVRGRTLDASDVQGTEPVVVVSESVAARYWPGENPLGRRLYMGQNLDRALTVVGIVPDTRYRDLRDARATVYFPLAQSFFGFAPLTLAIRSSGSPLAMLPALRQKVGESAPGVVVARAALFDEYMAGPLALPRLNAFLLLLFAATALALAAVGLFGVMTATVRQRTRELGVRMALGATSRSVFTLVLSRGLVVSSAGLCIGIGCALAANRVLGALLYDVAPTDVATLAGVAGAVLGVTAVAVVLPARATRRIDPNHALRAVD